MSKHELSFNERQFLEMYQWKSGLPWKGTDDGLLAGTEKCPCWRLWVFVARRGSQ